MILFQKQYTSSPEHTALLASNKDYRIVEELSSEEPPFMPMGSVEFCRHAMDLHNVEEPFFNYSRIFSNCLLTRDLKVTSLATAKMTSGIYNKPMFVKPVMPKLFEAGVYRPYDFPSEVNGNELVYIGTPINIINEWRIYILDKQILGVAQYDQGDSDVELTNSYLDFVEDYIYLGEDRAGILPRSFTLDVGTTDTGHFGVIEYNDAWGTGFYPWAKDRDGNKMKQSDYIEWLEKRWNELVSLNKRNSI